MNRRSILGSILALCGLKASPCAEVCGAPASVRTHAPKWVWYVMGCGVKIGPIRYDEELTKRALSDPRSGIKSWEPVTEKDEKSFMLRLPKMQLRAQWLEAEGSPA